MFFYSKKNSLKFFNFKTLNSILLSNNPNLKSIIKFYRYNIKLHFYSYKIKIESRVYLECKYFEYIINYKVAKIILNSKLNLE